MKPIKSLKSNLIGAPRTVQFECRKDGTLFYYVSGNQSLNNVVSRCPVCGSRRIEQTGRTFPELVES